VRLVSLLFIFLVLAGCNRGIQNKDAVRQGVLDYLSKRTDLSMGGMTVDVTNVSFQDNRADAQVTFLPKEGPPGGGMTMRYTLEQKDNSWVVVGKADSGRNPHAGAAAAVPPGMPNPHTGGAMPQSGGIDTERPPSEKK
jgi:hypothetical protein